MREDFEAFRQLVGFADEAGEVAQVELADDTDVRLFVEVFGHAFAGHPVEHDGPGRAAGGAKVCEDLAV